MNLTLEDIKKVTLKEFDLTVDETVVYKGTVTAQVEQEVIKFFTEGDVEQIESEFITKAMLLTLGLVDGDRARETLKDLPGLSTSISTYIIENDLVEVADVVSENLYKAAFIEVGTLVLNSLENTPTR